MTSANIETFTFYDLETYGTDPKQDRIVQFAGIRTDINLNPVEQLIVYCKPQKDYLPSVEAVTVTGITPAFANRKGLSENIFIETVLNFLSAPNNCVLGYNSIKFDDEFIRNTAFRNFFSPYAYNSFNNSSRWDVYPLIRLCCALCPEGIEWPFDENEGRYVLKLEELSRSNGLTHEHAHDAMSDVIATIDLLKLIITKQQPMFNFVFSHRTKRQILEYLVDSRSGSLTSKTLLAVDSTFGPEHLYVGAVLPVFLDETASNLYCWNLIDPVENFNELPDLEELDCSAVPMSDLGIIKIKLNACPVLVPYNTLNKNNRHERVNISPETVKANLQLLNEKELLRDYMSGCISKYRDYYKSLNGSAADPELALYDYLSKPKDERDANQLIMNQIHASEKKDPSLLCNIRFSSRDMNELLFRYKARNYEFILSEEERNIWNQKISEYGRNNAGRFMTELNDMCIQNEKDQRILEILKETAVFYGITG
jgi:exodeoxyribonuclease-1